MSWGKRAKVAIVAAAAALVGGAGVLNATVDLWGRTAGGGTIDIGYRTADPGGAPNPVLWDETQTECFDLVMDQPPALLRQPADDDDLTAAAGDVGVDHRHGAAAWGGALVHTDIVDVDPDSFSVAAFAAAGAYHTGVRKVDVLLANRTAEQVIVTDILLEVDRREPPRGTIMAMPGADAIPLHVIEFDLAEPAPVAHGITDDCQRGTPFFDEYALAIDPGETEIVSVLLSPGECLCLARLNLEYWHEGDWQQLTVPPAEMAAIPVVQQEAFGTYDMVYLNHGHVDGDPQRGEQIEKFDCRRESGSYCSGTPGAGGSAP